MDNSSHASKHKWQSRRKVYCLNKSNWRKNACAYHCSFFIFILSTAVVYMNVYPSIDQSKHSSISLTNRSHYRQLNNNHSMQLIHNEQRTKKNEVKTLPDFVYMIKIRFKRTNRRVPFIRVPLENVNDLINVCTWIFFSRCKTKKNKSTYKKNEWWLKAYSTTCLPPSTTILRWRRRHVYIHTIFISFLHWKEENEGEREREKDDRHRNKR